MNKINEGGVKTSAQVVIGTCKTNEDEQFEVGVAMKKYNNLFVDDKNIIDVLKNTKYNKSNSDHINFIATSITVQIEARLINCIDNIGYIDLHSNILSSQICNLISAIVEGIISGDKDIDSRSLLYHNIMALFTIHKCSITDPRCENLMAFINYFCDSFIE